MEQENASFEDGGGAECSFAKALLQAYENRDISALTIALCNNTMFDLLRTAYLIPYRFHGKNGGNPRLLTDANGEVREEYRNAVSARELRKFHDIYRQHLSVPRAALYLADGSHLRHKYTKDMQVREMYSPSRRGVLTLYALPDTVEQGLTEAQAYNIVWDAFNEIQQKCPTAMVFYGQDTGLLRILWNSASACSSLGKSDAMIIPPYALSRACFLQYKHSPVYLVCQSYFSNYNVTVKPPASPVANYNVCRNI